MTHVEEPVARSSIVTRDWTKGSILGNLWTLSWPTIVSNTINMLGPAVDMIWVGKLGSDAVAGVGLAGMAVQLVFSMVMGIFAGMGALVARSIGAKDYDGAIQAVRQALVVSGVFSIIMALVGIFFSSSILNMFGVGSEVVAEGAAYLRIQFLGIVTASVMQMTMSTMMASGDTMNPMRIAIIYRLFHVALCPFLVFGWWIFPRLGVSGASIVAVFSQSLGAGLGLWFLFTGRTRLRLNFNNFRLDVTLLWRIIRIGVPAAVSNMDMSLVGLVIMRFIAPFGTAAVAAHIIMSRVEQVILMPGMGFGQAAGTLVGQNLGAHQPERAEKSGWVATALVETFTVVCAAVLILWAGPIIRIFDSDPGVVDIGSTFIRIAAIGYFFVGITLVLMTCLNGAGDTLPPMMVGLISMWGAQIPLAYILPRVSNLGVYGVRWAIVIAMVMRALTYLTYFKVGRWKRKRV